MVVYSAIPYIAGGFMAALALRYDYSQSPLSSSSRFRAAPGEAVQIVNTKHTFPAPTFIAALTALAGCMAWSVFTTSVRQPFGFEGLAVIFVVPAVSLAMMGCAAVRGDFKQFWQYREEWSMTKEKSTRTPTLMKEKSTRVPKATDIEALGKWPFVQTETEKLDSALYTEAMRKVPLGDPHCEKMAILLSGRTDAERLAIMRHRQWLLMGRYGEPARHKALRDWHNEYDSVKR